MKTRDKLSLFRRWMEVIVALESAQKWACEAWNYGELSGSSAQERVNVLASRKGKIERALGIPMDSYASEEVMDKAFDRAERKESYKKKRLDNKALEC